MKGREKAPDRERAARFIDDFISGSGGPRDWDDFTTYPMFSDPEVKAIVLISARLPEIFPAEDGAYCGDLGITFLAAVRDYLRRK